MANPQPTDSHLRLAVAIQDELTIRDFTKRQYKIINLVLRVSWACGKKYAVIPQYTKYFKACGIHKSDIKKEINTLIKNNVLSWEQSTNVFEFNKNFDAWLIPYHPDVEKDAIRELISLNLKSWQNTNSVGETQTEFGNNTNSVGEKSELTEAGNADAGQETGSPITSIITSIYNLCGEFKNVKLSNEQVEKLRTLYGNKFNEAVEKLSSYIEANNKQYKNHYAVLGAHNWVYREVIGEVKKEQPYNAYA